jgi:hypothetical protein
MATRIKLYFIVLFAQWFFLFLHVLSLSAANFYLATRTKCKKLSFHGRKKSSAEITAKASSLSAVAFFHRVCESLCSSLRVHLDVMNPIVCLILHINQTLRTR